MYRKHETSTRISAITASTLAAALLLAGCGDSGGTPQSSTKPSAATSSPAASDSSTGGSMDQAALLKINDKLSTQLGQDYVQGWIKDGKLHVSTTNEQSVQSIKDAGAVAHVVQYSAAQLREAITKIVAWQASLDAPLGSSVHAYTLNPETGGLTLSVDPAHRAELEQKLGQDKPVGGIPVDFKDSSGIASPAVPG